MAAINNSVKYFSVVASILGIVQSIAWIVLSLISILIYTEVWIPEFDSVLPTYGQHISLHLYSMYLDANAKDDPVHYILPLQVFIIAILYLILSLIWLSISCFQLWSSIHEQNKLIKKINLGWAVCTGVISIYDFVFASFLASDYDTRVQELNKVTNITLVPAYHILANGILMTLAARGFVLWIINIFLIVIATKLSMGFENKVSQNNFSNANTINAFEPSNPAKGFDNPAFSNSNFTRNEPFIFPKPHQATRENHSLPRIAPISNTNDRLARIKGQGVNSPSLNIPTPKLPQSYIYPSQPRMPSPDYSFPFQQPQLKTSLKDRTQNVYGYANNGRY